MQVWLNQESKKSGARTRARILGRDGGPRGDSRARG